MRHNPTHEETDPAVVRRLIDANPWATLISQTAEGLVASHYPVLRDEGSEELALLTHVGRPDEKNHDFGDREMLVIVAGTHGYISPSWYEPGTTPAPTWNFSVAHLYGVPEALEPEENLDVLERLVAHFEQHVDEPQYLDREWGAQLAKGTVGIRVPITRFVCKVKMSLDKPVESQRRVLEALRRDGPYRNDALADDMERAGAGGSA
jgi:transcriptional regulator